LDTERKKRAFGEEDLWLTLLAFSSIGLLLSQLPDHMAANEARCYNQYLAVRESLPLLLFTNISPQTKINVTYDAVKSNLREGVDKKNGTKTTNALGSLTFFKCEKELLDMLMNCMCHSETCFRSA
jgi:DNA-binding protein Fis